MHGFVPLDPRTAPFDAGIIDKDLAAQLFPPPGTVYDREAALRRYISTGAKVDMFGLEFTQFRFRLKLDDLTGKVVVLGQLKIRARADGQEVAVSVKHPCFEHVALIPAQELRGNGAFEKRGEWMVCQVKTEKGEGETLEEFWERCRRLPGEVNNKIFRGSRANLPGFQGPPVFFSRVEDVLAGRNEPPKKVSF